MAFGINALNDFGEVIISSELKNLHFIAKLTTPESSTSFTGFGGSAVHIYRVNNCPTIPVPFIHMLAGNEAATTAVRSVDATTWDIEVVTNNNIPTLYIFADATAAIVDSDFGMNVYNADGTAAFASSARPLAVTNAVNITPPSSPRVSFSPSSLNAKYCADNGGSSMSSSYAPNNNIDYPVALPEKPMFFYFSLGQAELEASWSASEEECDGFDAKGNCVGSKRNYSWTSTYWAFYRASITWTANGIVRSLWTTVNYDCYWTSSTNGSVLGIGTGSSSGSDGTWPYSNETINLAPNIAIMGDASNYD